MKQLHKLLSCSCALFLSLLSPAFSDFAHTPGKNSVIVLQGEVTVDGQQRSDLGRSFADTLTGGLLKTKAYSVIDHLSNQPLAKAIEESTYLAPEQSAVSIGKATGARYIFVPRMIIEGDFHKLTMKKIRVSDGQVIDMFETHGTGGRETMFVLVGDALKDIYRKTARDPARLGKTSTGEPLPLVLPEPAGLDATPLPIPGSYEPVRPLVERTPPAAPVVEQTEVVSADTQRIPEGLKLENGTHVREAETEPAITLGMIAAATPEPPEIKDPATEVENKFARYMGTVSTVNSEWRFCILKLRIKHPLNVGDQLSIRTGAIVPNQVTMKVTKVEGTHVVADLVDDVDLKKIRVGQKFYKWTPR
ncbi:MAG: hypothetical protein ACI8XO_003829 [Verrucomicrobiales bacterium]|jgi:hypothetical protein